MDTNIEDKITPDERELFELLKSIISVVSPQTTLRVAGGWVRDKLLNKESDDIDLVSDNVSGEKIARLITDFLGLEGPHVIEANPDASKHLETAGAKIPISNGTVFDVDFAMARKEINYDEDSRIPDIQPGTIEDDAFRRDLTMNSLFYNIMNGELEDLTGRGLEDLENRIIKTPKDPLQTFKDDPLRIFRAIRFTARFDGKIDPETYEAMMDPSLRSSIQAKIKKERIQEELYKTLKGPNPSLALRLLKDTGIMRDILEESTKGSKYEGKLAPFDMDQNNPHHELTVWDHTMKVVDNILDFYPDTDPDRRVIMILTALMHDFGKLAYEIHGDNGDTTSYHGHEDASEEIAQMILKYLRFNNKMSTEISKLVGQHMKVHNLDRQDVSSSKALRKFLRRMGEASLNWVDVMNHTIADAYSKGAGEVPIEVIEKYKAMQHQLETALLSMSLSNESTKVVPILNGKDIMDLGIPHGPMVGQALEFVKELMDDVGNSLTPENARSAVIEKFNLTPPTDQTKEASACPTHLLENSIQDIHDAIQDKNATKAMALVRTLREEFMSDDNVDDHLAPIMFDILLLDRSQKDMTVLKHLFDAANQNFFNTELCVPVLGILLLIETGTEDKVIETVFERMNNMDGEKTYKMLSKLPKSSHRAELAKKFINSRNG